MFPRSAVTSGQCELSDDRFKLIFTPQDGAYKLSASNPGQFFYDIFDQETGGEFDFTVTLPDPFMTHGSNPVHAYSSGSIDSSRCFVPGDSISDITVTGGPGGVLQISVDSPTDFVFISIHLTFGLKGEVGYSELPNLTATHAAAIKIILDNGAWTFSVADDQTDTQTVYNTNVFKHDPGFAGLVIDSVTFSPVAGATVLIKKGSETIRHGHH